MGVIGGFLFPNVAALGDRGVSGSWGDFSVGALKGASNVASAITALINPLSLILGGGQQVPISETELGGAAAFEVLATVATFGTTSLESAAARGVPQVLQNRVIGNAFRDELADLLIQAGREVTTEVYKKTPFGKRFMDIEVSMDGTVLGGIETKVGGSRYPPLQQIKDWWLKNVEGYPVNVARKP